LGEIGGDHPLIGGDDPLIGGDYPLISFHFENEMLEVFPLMLFFHMALYLATGHFICFLSTMIISNKDLW
jgi:hypothetical protein